MSPDDLRRHRERRARLLARAGRAGVRAGRLRSGAGGGIRLNMAAMIDIVFLLLIYFVLIVEFRPSESSFTTAAATGPAASADPFTLPERPITIRLVPLDAGTSADPDTAFQIRCASPVLAEATTLDAFADAARKAYDLLLDPVQEFVIVPSPQTRWEHALRIVNALQLAGFSRVRFDHPAEHDAPDHAAPGGGS
jgi:biopolymer transport protein ExbD